MLLLRLCDFVDVHIQAQTKFCQVLQLLPASCLLTQTRHHNSATAIRNNALRQNISSRLIAKGNPKTKTKTMELSPSHETQSEYESDYSDGYSPQQYPEPQISGNPDWDKDTEEIASLASEELHETRPNRWTGSSSTCVDYMQRERRVWESVEGVRSRDLAVHLFNAFALRRRLKGMTGGGMVVSFFVLFCFLIR